MPDWVLERSELFERRFRQYQKKHRAETIATLVNLEKYLAALNAGAKPGIIHKSFVHYEPQGVVAIDQKGAKGGSRETRLYTYAVEVGCVLHLITMGDKKTQKQDLKDCNEFVRSLLKRREGRG